MTSTAEKVKTAELAQQSGVAVDKHNPTIFDLVGGRKDRYARTLNDIITPELFVQTAVTTIAKVPGLAACTNDSILGSLMVCAQLSLAPGGPLGHAYLVPFKRECTFILGYKGAMALAMRSGEIASVKATAVYDGDDFSWTLGLREDLRHEPTAADRGNPDKLTHVYAIARFRDRNIDPLFVVLTRAEVERYRARSKAKNNGPWVTDYVAMSLKTGVHRLKTWLPMAVDLARASALDDRVFTKESSTLNDYIEAEGEEVTPTAASPSPEATTNEATFDCDLCQGAGLEADGITICEACNGTGAAHANGEPVG